MAAKAFPLDNEALDGQHNRAAGMLAQGVVLVVTGALTLGMGSSVIAKSEPLSALAGAWEVGGGTLSSIAVQAILVSAFLGAASIVIGILGAISNFVKNRMLAILVLSLTVLISAVQIGSAILYIQLVDNSEFILEPSQYTTNFNAEQVALSDLASVVHNRCCFDESNGTIPTEYQVDLQLPILPCPAESDLDPNLPPVCSPLPKVLADLQELSDVFCTCFNEETFFKIEQHVVKFDLCKAFEAVEVPVGTDLEVPVAGTSLDSLLKLTQYASFLPIENMAMSGPVVPVVPPLTDNGELSSKDQGEEAFNCGLGNMKGIAFIQNVFLEQNLLFTSILFGVGSVQLLAVILVAVYWCLGNAAGEDWMDFEDRVTPDRKESF